MVGRTTSQTVLNLYTIASFCRTSLKGKIKWTNPTNILITNISRAKTICRMQYGLLTFNSNAAY
jgi:hypothetical protein